MGNSYNDEIERLIDSKREREKERQRQRERERERERNRDRERQKQTISHSVSRFKVCLLR